MAGLPGRRYAAAATAVALVSLFGGSWLVVSAAGASTAPPRVASAAAPPRAAQSRRAVVPPVSPSADIAPLAVGGASPTAGPTTGDTPETTAASTPGTAGDSASTTTAPSSAPATPSTTVTTPASPTTTAPATPPPLSAAPLAPALVPDGNATASAPPVTTTESQVARELIAAIVAQSGGRFRVPATPDNITLLARWVANEGGLWANNPLNTSLYSGQYPHEIAAGGQDTGDPIFPTMSVGIAATATTLLMNPAYDRILTVLRSGHESCLSFAKAVIQSPWASSHYEHSTARFCGGSSSPGPVAHHGHHRR